MLRYKIFFWLALHDRLNTRNLLNRKSFYLPSYCCAMCNETQEETLLHLFWDYTFAQIYWFKILSNKHIGISFSDEVLLALLELPKDIGLDIVIMGCWSIWTQRNDKIFRYAVLNSNNWAYILKDLLMFTIMRMKPHKA